MTPRPIPAREPLLLAVVAGAVLLWSGIGPHDRLTWWLEVAPVFIGLAICFATYSNYRLSPLLYRLLFLHAVILMIGGHYTYALVPIGDWFRNVFDLSRNHYDRVGHLAQGFIPAILAREVLLRSSPLVQGKWLFVIATSLCLAFSAFYEMLEWWAALAGGESAESFLGTQGDIWDTQWDMFLALLGAMASQLLLARMHDRSLAKVVAPRPALGD